MRGHCLVNSRVWENLLDHRHRLLIETAGTLTRDASVYFYLVMLWLLLCCVCVVMLWMWLCCMFGYVVSVWLCCLCGVYNGIIRLLLDLPSYIAHPIIFYYITWIDKLKQKLLMSFNCLVYLTVNSFSSLLKCTKWCSVFTARSQLNVCFICLVTESWTVLVIRL